MDTLTNYWDGISLMSWIITLCCFIYWSEINYTLCLYYKTEIVLLNVLYSRTTMKIFCQIIHLSRETRDLLNTYQISFYFYTNHSYLLNVLSHLIFNLNYSKFYINIIFLNNRKLSIREQCWYVLERSIGLTLIISRKSCSWEIVARKA